MRTITGLERLLADAGRQGRLRGNIAYLCNSTSVDRRYRHGLTGLKACFGRRLRAAFAPQHGLFTDAQDNMIESPHGYHQHFDIPVYSLYSEVRQPTAEMLEGIDHLLIDLQDVGVRVYTYVYSALLAMEACGRAGVEVVVLDRPNPLGGEGVEGNILDPAFRSFIGLYPLPMRHGMTLGELARMAVRDWGIECKLTIIEMTGWERALTFEATGLPWVLPSPNFPSMDTARVYPGAVLLEGTNLSEGRGTVRPFELFGHPRLRPYEMLPVLEEALRGARLEGWALRPLAFTPTFDKYAGESCPGFQLHVTDPARFRPWRTGQVLLRELYHLLGEHFAWRQPPFEYVDDLPPIDILNGGDAPRHWVERRGTVEELDGIEAAGRAEFLARREEVLIY